MPLSVALCILTVFQTLLFEGGTTARDVMKGKLRPLPFWIQAPVGQSTLRDVCVVAAVVLLHCCNQLLLEQMWDALIIYFNELIS